MRHELFVNVKGFLKRWKPMGPIRQATARSRREVRIVNLILDGQTADFAQAVALMQRGCDYDRVLDLGRKYRRTGRVTKAVVVANQIFSGEIPKEEADAYIRGLAISAGN